MTNYSNLRYQNTSTGEICVIEDTESVNQWINDGEQFCIIEI